MGKMIGKFKTELVALAAVAEALVAVALAFDWISDTQGASLTGAIAAFLVFVRQTTTAVSKVAGLVEKPVGVVNDLLKKVT